MLSSLRWTTFSGDSLLRSYFFFVFNLPSGLCIVSMKDKNKVDFKKIVSDNWVEPLKREIIQSLNTSSKPCCLQDLKNLEFLGCYSCVTYSSRHQKNQVKDTIEVEESEDEGER